MNDNNLEERITDYGTRWRDAHQFPGDVDTTRLTRRSHRKTVVAIVAVAAVIVAALGVAAVVRDTDAPKTNPVAPPSTLVTPSTSDAPVPGEIPTPLRPIEQTRVPLDLADAPIAYSNGHIWVGTPTGIDEFDRHTLQRVGHVATDLPVLQLAAADELWVLTGDDSDLDTTKNAPYRLERIETTHLAVAFSHDLPFSPGYRSHELIRLAASDRTAWVSLGASVERIDADGNKVTPISLSGRGAGDTAADNTGLWINSNFSVGPASVKIVPMLHIDTADNEVSVVPGVPDGFSWSVATYADAAWVVTSVGADGLKLVRIDELTQAVKTYPIAGDELVTGDEQLWVQMIDPSGRKLSYNDLVGQIDPETGAITRTYKIAIGEVGGSNGYPAEPFAVADGKIWSAYNGLQRTTIEGPASADPSSPTSPTSPTSTTITVPASIPPTHSALDLRTGTAFGFGPAGTEMKAQTVRDVLTHSLGPPTHDTGWFITKSTSPEDCIGSLNSRVIRWGNLSYAFWHLQTGGASGPVDQYTLWSWALGRGIDQHEPAPIVDTPALPATTADGIGIGTTLTRLQQQYGAKLNVADDQQSAIIDTPTGTAVVFLLTDGKVTGIQSRLAFC